MVVRCEHFGITIQLIIMNKKPFLIVRTIYVRMVPLNIWITILSFPLEKLG